MQIEIIQITSDIFCLSVPRDSEAQLQQVCPQPAPPQALKHLLFSVDLAEVELVHDPKFEEPRHNDTELFRVSPSN